MSDSTIIMNIPLNIQRKIRKPSARPILCLRQVTIIRLPMAGRARWAQCWCTAYSSAIKCSAFYQKYGKLFLQFEIHSCSLNNFQNGESWVFEDFHQNEVSTTNISRVTDIFIRQRTQRTCSNVARAWCGAVWSDSLPGFELWLKRFSVNSWSFFIFQNPISSTLITIFSLSTLPKRKKKDSKTKDFVEQLQSALKENRNHASRTNCLSR